MRHDDISIAELVAQSVVPAREAAGRRGLLPHHEDDLASRRLWPLERIEDVLTAFAAAGAVVNECEMFEVTPRGLAPVRPPGIPEESALPSLLGNSARWGSRRNEGEAWADYRERSLDALLAPIRAMRQEVMLGRAGDFRFDFSFVTEDESALFELPAYVRARLWREIDAAERFGLIELHSARNTDGRRVMRARPVPGSYYGAPAEDVAAIPRDARFAWLRRSPKNLRRLGDLTALEHLTIWRPGVKTLEAIATLPALRSLEIHDVDAPSLAPLGALSTLEMLTCVGRSVLRDVTALAALPKLWVLHADLRGLNTVEQLGSLARLKVLGLGGDNSWRIASLAPLASLRELRRFSMWGLRVADGSLRPLAGLSKLVHLRLQTSRFRIEEFAELAAALPEAEGPHRSPWTHSTLRAQLVHCKNCKDSSGYSTLGKPSRSFCFKCDAAKIAKHVARWEILVSAARARRG